MAETEAGFSPCNDERWGDDAYDAASFKGPVVNSFLPTFWDDLSKIWLTSSALREIDRRNTTRLAPTAKTPKVLPKNLAQFARHGGPDLCHLRGCPNPYLPARKAAAVQDRGTMISPYGREFQQHLADHGVYMNDYLSQLANVDDLIDGLAQRRASLSPAAFSQAEFEALRMDNNEAISELDVVTSVVPVLRGGAKIHHKQNVRFADMAALTSEGAVRPMPDWFDGARRQDLHAGVRDDPDLGPLIIPTKDFSVPVAPNFFLEVKGPAGQAVVAQRQACYDGAHGARATRALQSYGQQQQQQQQTDAAAAYPGSGGSTWYAFSSTYVAAVGTLELYAHHVTAPTMEGERPGYHMTKLFSFCMTLSRQSFAQGATAFRNARDMAKKQRDDLIKAANARASQAAEAAAEATAEDPAQRHVVKASASVGSPACSYLSDCVTLQDADDALQREVADARHRDDVADAEDCSRDPEGEVVASGDDASASPASNARPDLAAGSTSSKRPGHLTGPPSAASTDGRVTKRRALRSRAR
ncbi:hypothetical protein N3K66_005306 [Trichothecium roseum]|uniref:Uncharacterized protein n=1 Tax=Trichothecium roseum TaxID=47278 RepID=A0ACC0UZ99_9HYPO|nr:hypothetical protein N3K66_005306 [Trichothecium roseum]